MKNNEMKMYISYEEPFNGKAFTSSQMHEVYRDMVDKDEYQDFTSWLLDMLKSGVFEIYDFSTCYETENAMYNLLKDFEILNPETIEIMHFIAKLMYTTLLIESDAMKLAKEYCLYGTLSLGKYDL